MRLLSYVCKLLGHLHPVRRDVIMKLGSSFSNARVLSRLFDGIPMAMSAYQYGLGITVRVVEHAIVVVERHGKTCVGV